MGRDRALELWNFGDNNDGREPYSGVTFDAAGDLYGTTALGGSLACIQNSPYDTWGCGTIFELTKTGNSWTENILKTFSDDQTGSYSLGGLLFDSSSGTLYGATGNAYPSQGTDYGGTFFQLTSTGFSTIGSGLAGPLEQVSGPHSGLVMDSSGNLYGTTASGGTYNLGTVFELPYSNGTWDAPVTLYNFQGGSDGEFPVGGVVLDSNGNLYGTTYSGVTDGTGCSLTTYPLGCGMVFKITP